MALWIEAESVELRSNATEDDLQAVIWAVYRHRIAVSKANSGRA